MWQSPDMSWVGIAFLGFPFTLIVWEKYNSRLEMGFSVGLNFLKDSPNYCVSEFWGGNEREWVW